MGSDLHMSPPTPDETRLVRSGNITAVYTRHTDGIYGDTKTWTRQHFISDPTRAAFDSFRAMHPLWKVVTLDPETQTGMPPTLPCDALRTADRDFEAEERELLNKAERARQKAAFEWENAVIFEQKAAQVRAEAKEA